MKITHQVIQQVRKRLILTNNNCNESRLPAVMSHALNMCLGVKVTEGNVDTSMAVFKNRVKTHHCWCA